jgi:hypothetical protein
MLIRYQLYMQFARHRPCCAGPFAGLMCVCVRLQMLDMLAAKDCGKLHELRVQLAGQESLLATRSTRRVAAAASQVTRHMHRRRGYHTPYLEYMAAEPEAAGCWNDSMVAGSLWVKIGGGGSRRVVQECCDTSATHSL